MIEQIYAILTADAALMAIVGSVEPKGETDKTGDLLLYEYMPGSDNKITMTARLQLTVICGRLKNALAADRRIRSLLVTQGDKPLSNNILRVTANGGGHLHDASRRKHHQIIYFDLLGRSDSNG